MCSICCEKFSKTKRKQVTCPYCSFECCKTCFEKYLLLDNEIYSKCMSCKQEISSDFLYDTIGKTFYNTKFLEKRANDSMSRERSLLPSTQIYVKRELEKRNLIKESKQKQAEIENLQKLINSINFEKRAIDITLANQYSDITDIDITTNRKQFTLPCPYKDCKGFLSQNYKCGTCSLKVCSQCREPKQYTQEQMEELGITEYNHECNKDTLETIKLIKNDSKPCPKCSVAIHKIDGCDQMYCTSCNTAFSWKTSKIVTSRIHNPHYYEYLRLQANGAPIRREPGTDPCEQQVDFNIIRNAINRYKSIASINDELSVLLLPMYVITNSVRMPLHIRDVILPDFPLIEELETSKAAIQNRVKYLLNELPQEKWKTIIKSRIKRSDFCKNINDLLNMVATIIETTYQNTFDKYKNPKLLADNDSIYNSIPKFLFELENIKKYANEQFRLLNRKYNLRTFVITEMWLIKPSNSHIIPRVCNCDYDPTIKPNRPQRQRFNVCKC